MRLTPCSKASLPPRIRTATIGRWRETPLTYSEAIQYLYSFRLFGTKLGLDQTRDLAARAGKPHERLRFIHVAGTNGKGSTCAMLESVYRAAGLRVGLFTSPHLVSFRERIQVNRQLIGEDDVVRHVQEMQSLLQETSDATHPTFFEVVTVLALRYFAEKSCDLVVWETGLGGRLDATNIVTPLACVITNVQLDHERWLGSTLSEIAAEKGGIIKPGVPALTAAAEPEALEVLRRLASAKAAPLTHVTWRDTSAEPLATMDLPLLGDHQRLNAALALATVRTLQPLLPAPDSAIRAGFEQVQWPGRLQLHRLPNGSKLLLDGAHNPAGAETLHQAMQRVFPRTKPTLILGVMRDKDWQTMCRTLAPLANRILLVPVHSERTAAPEDLERACATVDPGIPTLPCTSLSEALARAEGDPFILVTGSLHLVGEAMELLQLLPGGAAERLLNEWDSAALGPREHRTTP